MVADLGKCSVQTQINKLVTFDFFRVFISKTCYIRSSIQERRLLHVGAQRRSRGSPLSNYLSSCGDAKVIRVAEHQVVCLYRDASQYVAVSVEDVEVLVFQQHSNLLRLSGAEHYVAHRVSKNDYVGRLIVEEYLIWCVEVHARWGATSHKCHPHVACAV